MGYFQTRRHAEKIDAVLKGLTHLVGNIGPHFLLAYRQLTLGICPDNLCISSDNFVYSCLIFSKEKMKFN